MTFDINAILYSWIIYSYIVNFSEVITVQVIFLEDKL